MLINQKNYYHYFLKIREINLFFCYNLIGGIIMYQALYRKYRPVDFDSVIGQNSIVNTLKNSIIYNKVNHAYLFFVLQIKFLQHFFS